MFSDETTFFLIQAKRSKKENIVTIEIPCSSMEQDALMRYRHRKCSQADVQIVMEAVDYVAKSLLPRAQYSDSFREDFSQELLCHLLTVPSDTLTKTLEQRGFNAVLFYQGRSVKSEMVRKTPVVALPRRRKAGEVSKNSQIRAGQEDTTKARQTFKEERTRSHLRLIISKADVKTAHAMSSMLNQGLEPGEAAKQIGMSRPTFLRRLRCLGGQLAA